MEAILNSDILKLFVVLLAIIAIVFLFLRYRKNDEHPKVHMYYISGLCIFIILELVTYICVNNDNATEIVSYISFASTISSLFLSVVAIIYAIVSNNKGEAQYQKIDRASDRISSSVDRFSSLSESLSGNINSILAKLDELKVISNETKNAITEGNQQKPDTMVVGTLNTNKLIDDFILAGSYTGNLALLACVYSKDTGKPFRASDISDSNAAYSYGYIIASTALGIVTTHNNQDIIIVDNYFPTIKEKLLENIKKYINSSNPAFMDYNISALNKIQNLFGITDN